MGQCLGRGRRAGADRGRALHLNTTLKSLDLRCNYQREGGGRSKAETLRLNTTLTWLDSGVNDLGVERESALGQTWGDRGGSFQVEDEDKDDNDNEGFKEEEEVVWRRRRSTKATKVYKAESPVWKMMHNR